MKYAFQIFHCELICLSLIVSMTVSSCRVTGLCNEQTSIKSNRRTRIRGNCIGIASKRKGQTEDDFKLSVSDIEFDLISTICDIPQEEWDSCLSQDSSPFMQHSWLRCLEESGCATAETGWMPSHVAIRSGDKVCGFVPLYVKSHSMGEFIFDNNWAEAAAGNGIAYYPKLLVGVPFTPVAGNRILLKPNFLGKLTRSQLASIRRFVSLFLKKLAGENNLSSVHLNFGTDGEVMDIAGPIRNDQVADTGNLDGKVKSLLGKLKSSGTGYLRRTSIQYLWSNSNSNNEGRPYESFEEYLSCFKSKRRISVKRERQKVKEDEGIRIDAVVGREILKYDGLIDRMFELYLSTVHKMYWGRQYLTHDFFRLLAKSSFVDNLCFLCARRTSSGDLLKANDVIAGTFNCIKHGVFYGRYWGCLEEVKNLHFETCYWSAIDYCIREGLSHMEPGAGGGDYKWSRGFDPALVHSAHYIAHPGLRQAVCEFINYETAANVELQKFLMQNSAVGNGRIRKEETNA